MTENENRIFLANRIHKQFEFRHDVDPDLTCINSYLEQFYVKVLTKDVLKAVSQFRKAMREGGLAKEVTLNLRKLSARGTLLRTGAGVVIKVRMKWDDDASRYIHFEALPIVNGQPIKLVVLAMKGMMHAAAHPECKK